MGVNREMSDLVQKALSAKRESKNVEFKSKFDPSSPSEWCELTKDIVAMANSGGGIIVFGLDSFGRPTGEDLNPVASIDPADIVNKVSKYTGSVQPELEIKEFQKENHVLQAFVVQPVAIPIAFQKPGTYDIGSGKQRTAFAQGTIYFRHGAKSEPGTSDDIRVFIERQLELIRKSWVKGVRRVVQAPAGSEVITLRREGRFGVASLSGTVRAVNDPKATPVLLTRDAKKAVGSFIHEEISDGIFDEINNVVDANRVLARGQRRFSLGQSVYYRIYAERQHVVQREDDISLLLHSAICDMYAPALFWTLALPDESVGRAFAELYLNPKSPEVYCLIRLAALLGGNFCDWLADRWHRKWQRHPQPPLFYFTMEEMRSEVKRSLRKVDHCLLAARVKENAQFEVDGDCASAAELLNDPQRARALLSMACMRIFEGAGSGLRSTARELDYFAYGLQVHDKGPSIGRQIIKAVGGREPGDAPVLEKEK
jgi:Putative DNA-binding domain